MTVKISSDIPGKFSAECRASFIRFVQEGGEVGTAVIAQNVINAEALVFAGEGPEGIAALKNPLARYRKRISDSSGFNLDPELFPFELGYVFVTPDARGKGLSHELVNEAIRLAAGSGIFATVRTDNAPMLATLAKAGFEPKGHPYTGRSPERQIQIFVRPGDSASGKLSWVRG